MGQAPYLTYTLCFFNPFLFIMACSEAKRDCGALKAEVQLWQRGHLNEGALNLGAMRREGAQPWAEEVVSVCTYEGDMSGWREVGETLKSKEASTSPG